MELALDAMYGWLARHPHVAKADVARRYRLRPVVSHADHAARARRRSCAARPASPPTPTPALAHAWLDSLSIARHRRHARAAASAPPTCAASIHGKTGTLSTVIALSGVLDIDPQRPLVFSIVTNGDRPLSKGYVRKAHEQLVGLLVKYLAKTAKTPVPQVTPEPPKLLSPPTAVPEELDDEPEVPLDGELPR